MDRRRFVVVSHVYAMGPAFQLTKYLMKKNHEVIFIGHPFPYANDTRSFLRRYQNGKLVQEKYFWKWRGPELWFYVKDFLLTLSWAASFARHSIFVGVNNFNALAGYILKKQGQVKTLVFYTIDYIPQRFANSLLNRFYHWMDRKVVREADRVWNLSGRMVQAREEHGGDKAYRNKQIVVPIGTQMPDIDLASPRDENQIVFMGHLRGGQGVETLLEAFQIVVRTVPQAQLLIIGGGQLQESLEKMARDLGLESRVKFTGFVEKFSNVLQMLAESSVAVAPYADDEKTYTRYTDPGKPKDYLACGLPVVITRVPEVAFEIERRRCGLAVEDSPHGIAQALIRLLVNHTLRQEFRANALAFAREYSWDRVFHKALEATP